MGSFSDRMKRYDEYLSSSRFAGRTSDIANEDHELGHRARDARWRASSTTRARDLYHMEDRERYHDTSSNRSPSVSSRPKHSGNSSANLVRSNTQNASASTRRLPSPGYSSRQYTTNLEPTIPRRNSSPEDDSRYGIIPIGYDRNRSPVHSRPPVTQIPDRFDSDDSESDRSVHSTLSGYFRTSSDHLFNKTRQPSPELRYPNIRPALYTHQIDQTEREVARYSPSRATIGTTHQRDLLPLRSSSVQGSRTLRSSRRRGSITSQSGSIPHVDRSDPSSNSTLYTARQRDQLRTSVATSRFQSRNPSPTRIQGGWSTIQDPSDLGWENF